MTKYNRILLAMLAGSLSTSTIVSADEEDSWVNVYGKIFLTLDMVDEDNGDDQWELNSNASRFGVKGQGAAGDLEAFYQLEWEVDLTDSSKSSDDHIKARNQVVGLRGDFGEVFAGRHDTAMKKAQQKIDLFNDTVFDIKTLLNGEVRASGIVQYTTPKTNGFKAKLGFIPGEETGVNDGIADGISAGLDFKAGDVAMTLAYDDGVEGDDVETVRLAAQYKVDGMQFGLIYQDTDVDGASGDAFVASASFKSDNSTFKLQYVDSDIWETGVSSKVKYETQTVLGWDYKIAKATTFVSYYGVNEEGATADDDTVFGIGIIQKF